MMSNKVITYTINLHAIRLNTGIHRYIRKEGFPDVQSANEKACVWVQYRSELQTEIWDHYYEELGDEYDDTLIYGEVNDLRFICYLPITEDEEHGEEEQQGEEEVQGEEMDLAGGPTDLAEQKPVLPQEESMNIWTYLTR